MHSRLDALPDQLFRIPSIFSNKIQSLQIAAQRELRLRIVRERRVPWCRTKNRRQRESGFSSGFKFSVRYMTPKQCCEITTHDFVAVFVVVDVVVVFLLYIFDRHFRC